MKRLSFLIVLMAFAFAKEPDDGGFAAQLYR